MHPTAHRLPAKSQPLRGVRVAGWVTDNQRQNVQPPTGSEADWLQDAMAHWLSDDAPAASKPITPFARMGDGQPDT